MKKKRSIGVTVFGISLLMVIVTALSTPVQSKEDLDKDSGDLLTYYYLRPAPEKVPLALEEFISSKFFTSGQALQKKLIYTTAYSFGRIAQLEPSLIKEYEGLFNKTSHEGRLFILEIFQICGNEQVEEFLKAKLKDKNFREEEKDISKIIKGGIPIEFNPLAKEAKHASDLDFLWAEFMITGDERAVEKIINVLEWSDRTRNKLYDYLKSSASADRKEEIVDILGDEYNIKCNISNQDIETKDDLDIIITMNLMQQKTKSEPFQKIKEILNLSNEDILYMVTKWSAHWSLDSNAQQHKRVFDICDSEILKRSGSAKIGLLKISAYGYRSDNNIEKATDRLKQLVSLDPVNAWAHFSLGSIYIEDKNIKEAINEEQILQNLDMELASNLHSEIEFLSLLELDVEKSQEIGEKLDKANVIKDIVDKCEQVKSYRTRLTFTDFTQKVKYKDFFTIECDVKYVSPDRFFVDQSAWKKEGPVYDKRIKIGKEHYCQVGVWFKEPKSMESDLNNTFKSLTLDKWSYLIQNNDVTSLRIFQSEHKKFIVLNFSPRNLKDFRTEHLVEKTTYSAEIWAERPSLLIVRALLEIKGEDKKGNKIDILYEQTFKDYNSDIKIEEPKTVFDLNKEGSWTRPLKEFGEVETVEDAFDAYRNAVKDRHYSSLAKYATTESVQKGYHVMKDFQRANFLKYFDNNPYYVSYQGKTEAIIYFKESRNGTASPYIFTKEDGKWKIDFVKISQRIVYGPSNKWRWR